MKSYSKLFVIGGVLLVGAGLMMYFGNRGIPGTSTTNTGTLEVTAADWTRGGTETAPATLVEYGDFQCPACGAYYPLVKQLEADFGPSVRMVFRHMPLWDLHPNALPAGLAAEAAGKQGKFWEMADMLYEKQKDWSTLPSAKATFETYAETLGLDKAKFTADMEDKALLEKIQNSRKEGVQRGVQGTPTFYLNGKKLENPQSYEAFKGLVTAEIAKNPNGAAPVATTTLP